LGETRHVFIILVGKPGRKRPFERPRYRWEDNIKMDIKEVMCWKWIEYIWPRVVPNGGLS
jgi:hypothetical protein